MKDRDSVVFRMEKWLGAQVTLRTMEWKTYLDADEPVISCCLGSRGMRRTMMLPAS